jgi:hypothetical protein
MHAQRQLAVHARAAVRTWQPACSSARMTMRRTLILALSIALFIGAGWASSARDARPRSFSLVLLGASFIAGASALHRRQTAP